MAHEMADLMRSFATAVAPQFQALDTDQRRQFYESLSRMLELEASEWYQASAGERATTIEEQQPSGTDYSIIIACLPDSGMLTLLQLSENPAREAGAEERADGEQEGNADYQAMDTNEEASHINEEDGDSEATEVAPVPKQPRPRKPSDVRFSELVDHGYLAPGYYLWVEHDTMEGVRARMTYCASEGYHGRTLIWRVSCGPCDITRKIIRGTGPEHYVTQLELLGFEAPFPRQWGDKVSIYCDHPDFGEIVVGGITELKTDIFYSRLG